MKVHYVDDDEADLILMIEAARSIPEVSLTTSKTIDGLLDRMREDHVDCVLLDINRPDAHSLEDDIHTIYERSNLPIVLVTGTVEDHTRLRATLAGADGVIEKSALSKELVEQVLMNARARVLAKITEDVFESSAQPNSSNQPAPDWYEEIQGQLHKAEASITPSAGPGALSLILAVREAVTTAKRDEENNRSISACVPMRWAINAAMDEIKDVADQRQIRVTGGPIEGTFFPKGSRELGYLGLQLLLHGVVDSLQTGHELNLSANSNKDGKSTIVLSLSGQCFLSKDEFFGVRNLRDIDEFISNMRLKLAVLLLGLSRQDIVLGASLDHQLVSVDL